MSMKIQNPSVILKDGLWYGYTVEVPEEPKRDHRHGQATEFVFKIEYEAYRETLASANASLVKISNQEEVEKYVRIVNAWEAYKTTDKWNPKPGAIYNLDGYVMEVKGDCLTDCMGLCEECDAQQVATISPIQKQEPQAASFPDFEKYSAYKESKTVATSGTKYAAPDNQEELWRAVSKEINEEGLWQYEDWDGFKLTEKGIHYLKEQFTITRKP